MLKFLNDRVKNLETAATSFSMLFATTAQREAMKESTETRSHLRIAGEKIMEQGRKILIAKRRIQPEAAATAPEASSSSTPTSVDLEATDAPQSSTATATAPAESSSSTPATAPVVAAPVVFSDSKSAQTKNKKRKAGDTTEEAIQEKTSEEVHPQKKNKQ